MTAQIMTHAGDEKDDVGDRSLLFLLMRNRKQPRDCSLRNSLIRADAQSTKESVKLTTMLAIALLV
jgi:hypothetical protein